MTPEELAELEAMLAAMDAPIDNHKAFETAFGWDFNAFQKERVRQRFKDDELRERDEKLRKARENNPKQQDWEVNFYVDNIPNNTATVKEVQRFKAAMEADGIHVGDLVGMGQFGVIATLKNHPDIILRMEAKDAQKVDKAAIKKAGLEQGIVLEQDNDRAAGQPLDHPSTVQTLFRKIYPGKLGDNFHGFVVTAVPRVYESGKGTIEDFVTIVSSLVRDGKVRNWRDVSEGQISQLKYKGETLKTEKGGPVPFIHDLGSTVNNLSKGGGFFATAVDKVIQYREQVEKLKALHDLNEARKAHDTDAEARAFEVVKQIPDLDYAGKRDAKIKRQESRKIAVDASFIAKFDEEFKKDEILGYLDDMDNLKAKSRMYRLSVSKEKPMDDDKFLSYLEKLFQVKKANAQNPRWLKEYKSILAEMKQKFEATDDDREQTQILQEKEKRIAEIIPNLFILDPVRDEHRQAELQQVKVLDAARAELKQADLAPDILAQLDRKHECEIPPTWQMGVKATEIGAAKRAEQGRPPGRPM